MTRLWVANPSIKAPPSDHNTARRFSILRNARQTRERIATPQRAACGGRGGRSQRLTVRSLVRLTLGQRIPFFSLETFLESCALTGTVLVCGGFYFRYLRRFQTALSIAIVLHARSHALRARCFCR
ncbi:hypothetical protein V1507DRAFT_77775 [Lipomyces tetrasporus]